MRTLRIAGKSQYPSCPCGKSRRWGQSAGGALNMIKDTDLAWLAGIIDGEGSIMFFDKRKFDKRRNRQHGWIATAVSVTNCDELMIKKISNIFYDLGLHFHYTFQHFSKLHPTWKDALKIQTTGLNQCKSLLQAIRPYLVTKLYLAEFLLKYIEWRQDKGYGNTRNHICKEEIQKWFDLYEIVRQPKCIPSETTRKASRILGSG